MKMMHFIILVITFLFCSILQAQQHTKVIINSGDYQGLQDALASMDIAKVLDVEVKPDNNGFLSTFPVMRKLPLKMGARVRIKPGPNVMNQYVKFEGDNTDRFANLSNTQELWCNHCEFTKFGTSTSDGGVINIDGAALFGGIDTRYIDNKGRNGGAIFASGGGEIHLNGAYVLRNSATNNGGFASIGPNSWMRVYNIKAMDNTAGVFGEIIELEGGMAEIKGGSIHLGGTIGFEIPIGNIKLQYVDNYGTGDVADATSDFEFRSTIFYKTSFKNSPTNGKALCNDFGTGAFKSLGFNIANDNSCNLTQATDLSNTDPMMGVPDAEGVRTPLTGSPAIDGGPSALTTDHEAPCLYKDINGLGRPQDANGDGVFECDIGAVEIQNGADLSKGQSGVFYDTGRSGEGVFIEMLSATQAWVVFYTYDKNAVDLLWLVGIGDVVGNSIVVDEMSFVSGGNFGTAFNASTITQTALGSLSLVFPDCDATANPGVMTFNAEPDSGYEDLFSQASRITRVLNCDGSQPIPQSGRTGSFFEPTRSGEGILVHWLENNTVLLTWFTFTPDGKPFWIISANSTIMGDTVVLDMLYPQATPGFGSQFLSSDLVLAPWGTITLKYHTGCNSLDFSYDSIFNEYGSGSYVYQRLTTPMGTTCDL